MRSKHHSVNLGKRRMTSHTKALCQILWRHSWCPNWWYSLSHIHGIFAHLIHCFGIYFTFSRHINHRVDIIILDLVLNCVQGSILGCILRIVLSLLLKCLWICQQIHIQLSTPINTISMSTISHGGWETELSRFALTWHHLWWLQQQSSQQNSPYY